MIPILLLMLFYLHDKESKTNLEKIIMLTATAGLLFNVILTYHWLDGENMQMQPPPYPQTTPQMQSQQYPQMQPQQYPQMQPQQYPQMQPQLY